MAKFGEIISAITPTLIDFYTENNDQSLHAVLRDVAAALGDKAKVVKIDVNKNPALVNALKIQGTPTFIIYKESEMKWRQSGKQTANTLIEMVEQFI